MDGATGDLVHVDFSCLFDKGLELEKPEVVPFRLTQNMVDGLGVAGTDGVFAGVSAVTLSVLRSHKDTLMSVLETFLHDPLLEWTKAPRAGGGGGAAAALAAGGAAAASHEVTFATEALHKIRSRLEGVVVGVGAAPSLPLSAHGQARRLIEEATSLHNLGRLYIWWMAWF